MNNSVAVILLTYKRLERLRYTISSLLSQTIKSFDIYIIHNNMENRYFAESILSDYINSKKINFFVGDNKNTFFSRYFLAKKLAKSGYKIIFMLDDDVIIPQNYIERCLSQYEPKSYKSTYAYSFISNPPSYTKREKQISSSDYIGYCGPGMSMVDSSLFLNSNFFNKSIVNNFNKFDDIWISLFCLKNNWKLDYLDSGGILEGDDDSATYKNIMAAKQHFFDKLIKSGFSVPIKENDG